MLAMTWQLRQYNKNKFHILLHQCESKQTYDSPGMSQNHRLISVLGPVFAKKIPFFTYLKAIFTL